MSGVTAIAAWNCWKCWRSSNHAHAHTHDRAMKTYFDHERLNVYQEAIAFCGWVGDLLNQIAAKSAVKDQLDRASTSIPLNIAEGNGKFSNARSCEILRDRAWVSTGVCRLSGCVASAKARYVRSNDSCERTACSDS